MTTARPTPQNIKQTPLRPIVKPRVVDTKAGYAVLRHDNMSTIRGKECHWVIVRPHIGVKHQSLISGTFNSEGMTLGEVGAEVVRAVFSHYRETMEPVRLCIPQASVYAAFQASDEVPETVFLAHKKHPGYESLNQRAVTLLARSKIKAHSELHPWDTTGGDEYKKTQQRMLHVNSAMTAENGNVAAGYVIKDTYFNRALNSEEWKLQFGSTATMYVRYGGKTHAELTAILSVLQEGEAINSSVRHGHQSLIVRSNSKNSIELLNLFRFGTPVTFDSTITPIWKDAAEKVLFLLHDIDVDFQWVDKHTDTLSNAADALAIATLRTVDDPHQNESDILIQRGRIANQAVTALHTRGIQTRIVT